MTELKKDAIIQAVKRKLSAAKGKKTLYKNQLEKFEEGFKEYKSKYLLAEAEYLLAVERAQTWKEFEKATKAVKYPVRPLEPYYHDKEKEAELNKLLRFLEAVAGDTVNRESVVQQASYYWSWLEVIREVTAGIQ